MISYTLPPGCALYSFDDGNQWVNYKGKSIRSVSKILNVIYPMPPNLDPWYLERGRMVHAATVMIDKGVLDWDALDERIKPFCDAYVDFRNTSAVVVEASELVVVHPSYTYGGRLDRVYRLLGQARKLVTDIKCGTGKEDRYWLQVAALAMALDEANVMDYDLALLNLDSKGHPHFTVADHPGSWINQWREVLRNDAA
jgi:hypothetical protein